ncbi:MAG: hypothetical protein Q4D19_12310, partial [Lautropia sp.]|nr:hypothetical protein [Lautropia sp.]
MYTSRQNHRLRFRTVAAALLSALAAWTLPAQADITAVELITVSDGTPDDKGQWDPMPGDGFDTGPRNNIVRTHDTFQYRITFSTGGNENDARIRLVMPQHQGRPIARWLNLPSRCRTGSDLPQNGQILDCRLGDIRASGTESITLDAVVLGTAPDDAVIMPTLTVSTAQTPNVAINRMPDPIEVSAAPFYDVLIEESYFGNPTSHGFAAASGPNGQDGFYHRPLIGILARNPRGDGKKGVEQLDPTQPIKVTLDISGYPQSVRVGNFHVRSSNAGSFDDGCSSAAHGAPHDLFGGSVNMHMRVNDYGLGASTAKFAVAYGGDCNLTGTERNAGNTRNTAVTLDIVRTDTTLTHTPTNLVSTGSVAKDQFWVANKALVLWTDSADYPNQTEIPHPISLKAVTGKSISGKMLIDQNTANNSYSRGLVHRSSGRGDKVYQPIPNLNAPLGTSRDFGQTGDAYVNYMAPGQIVRSSVRFFNNGTTTQSNVVMCEIIDRTAFDISAPNVFRFRVSMDVTGTGSLPVNPTYSYGARVAGPFYASTDTTRTPTDRYTANDPAGSSEYSRASCVERSPGNEIRWFNTPEEAEAAGGLVFVRAILPALEGNRTALFQVDGLVLRETWAETISVQQPAPLRADDPATARIRRKGEPIAAGTIIRNRGQSYSDQVHSHASPVRDHLQVVSARTESRIRKSIIAPAAAGTANPSPVPAGTDVTYRLQGTYVTQFPAKAATVVITDILPPGARYIPGSSTVGGHAQEPDIQPDTPATGQTSLIWRFDNQKAHGGGAGSNPTAELPTIEFKARLAVTLHNGTVVRNLAHISGGPNDAEPDCVYAPASNSLNNCVKGASANLTIRTEEGFILEKTVSSPVVEAGERFDYQISATSMARDLLAPNIPDQIDILPFNGDGNANPALSFGARTPASKFQPGAIWLAEVRPANDPAAKIYYTSRTPAEIHNDPRDASNAIPGGATRWCLANELGSAGCPATVRDSTAVRVSPGITTMRANTPYEVTISMETDPMLTRKDDIFANRVGMRPASSASSLLFASSAAGLHTKIGTNYSSIGGSVFADPDRNLTLDGSDWPIADYCVSLSGTDVRGRNISYSMKTDAQGRYDFAIDTADRVFPSADCTGTAIPSFSGLLAGTYAISGSGTLDKYTNDQSKAGNAGGTAGQHTITGIALTRDGTKATGYDLTHMPDRPRLTLINSVKNDNGGTAQAGDFTLAAQNAATNSVQSGTVQQPAITAVSVDVGTHVLSASNLHGYTHGAWQCTINGAASTLSGPQLDTLSLDWRDEAICRIEHDDQPARLTLQKIVYNTNGGKAAPADFTLMATPEGSNAPLLTGTTGSPQVTGIAVMPGAYVLSETNLPGYTASPMWACSIPLKDGTPDTIVLRNGDDVNCAISNLDMDMNDPASPNVFVELTSIHVDNGDGSPNQTQHQDVQLHMTHVPRQGSSTPQSDANPPDVGKGTPVTQNLALGERYEIRGTEKRGYTTHLKCWMFNEQSQLIQQPNQADNLVLIERLTGHVSCTTELKRIPTTTEVSKTVTGEARQIVGTANEFEVDYVLTVKHSGGADGHYDLVDLPAFDPDVEIISAQASRNGTALNIQPVNGQWQLASQQELLMDATHEYQVRFHLRVPFGSNETNDACVSGTNGPGNGLFNQVRMTVRNDVSEALQNGNTINAANAASGQSSNTASTAEVCVPTPKAITSASLAIEKTSTTRSAEVGDLVTYRLRIRNLGEGPALSPVVVDRLPRGFRI